MSTQVSLTLFCLPYSGASAMFSSPWRRKLPEWLNVRPLALPGRGLRMDQPLPTDLLQLAHHLAAEISAQLATPPAVFGHSPGGLLALEPAPALRVPVLPA
ncbi:thioesterase, partial [Pseudomonas syringae]